MKKLTWLAFLLGCLLWTTVAGAKTLYVSQSGTDSGGCTSATTPCATIKFGIAAMAGGDTLMIGDGTYAEQITSMPSGSAAGYTTIQAVNDWGVTIDGSNFPNNYMDGIRVSASYVIVRGFHVKMNQANTENLGLEVFSSDHVKIQRCSISYSGTTDNVAAFSVGPAADYTLIEESYVYGGSRYPFLVYQSTHTVIRRCVSRLDYWAGSLQAANFTNYNGDMTVWQNNIAIDSDMANIGGSGLYAGFFNENKVPDSSWMGTATRETHRGNIVLNVKAIYSGIYDYDISNLHTYSDDIVWDSYGGYFGDYAHGDAPVLNATQMTIGMILGKYDAMNGQGSAGTGFYIGPGTGGMRVMNNVTNSIFWSDPSYGIADYAVGDYNSYWSDGAPYGGVYATPAAGAHDLKTNLTAGLKYLPRIETGSALATAGSGGGQIGAEVLMMWGTTGTLWGDPGYDTITTEPLWPYPNEAVIATDMASYTGPGGVGARGFATGTSKDGSPQTLTKYVWEYLGNQIPADVYGVHIVTESLAAGTPGTAYSASLTAGGGMSPYTWSVTGMLPAGLTLDAMAGTITGTPTTAATTSFTVVATDSSKPPATAMAPLEIVIAPAEVDAGASSDGGREGDGSAAGSSAHKSANKGCSCRLSAPRESPLGAGVVGVVVGLALLERHRHRQRQTRRREVPHTLPIPSSHEGQGGRRVRAP